MHAQGGAARPSGRRQPRLHAPPSAGGARSPRLARTRVFNRNTENMRRSVINPNEASGKKY
eukprot:3782181-Pleurochrysis_carterae.AAC.1